MQPEASRTRREPFVLVLLALAALVVSGIGPRDRATWWMEVAPVLIGAPLLLATHRRFPLTPLLYRLLFVHALILMLGGHYTYAEVPAGFWARDLLDLSRNPYDRLGHFAQGFVPAILVREVLLRTSPLRPGGWLFTLVTSVCLAFSALYELIEMAAALLLGQGADAFLGTQGDPWDTQWDMLLALAGALAAQLALSRVHDRQLARWVPARGNGLSTSVLAPVLALLLLGGRDLSAQVPRYDVGSPPLADLFVDPENGLDERDGRTRATAVRGIRAAWRLIPDGPLSGTGYRIRLMPGRHAGAYLESKRGTPAFPIFIEPADGPGTVTLAPRDGAGGNLTLFDAAHVYLQDFRISVPSGDGFQCERCDHVLLRRLAIHGQRTAGQEERVKLNQSRHVYIEDSEISGAGDNAIDAVAVQYGHVVGSRIHDANDWCLYLKGGSAYFRVEENEVYDCGTGGITAGQGSGFQFMVSPWLHYEAYDTRFVNNLVHDTEGAGLGVNGGYDILMAHNTLYRVGRRDHALEFVYGLRSCDGPAGEPGREACETYRQAGGWGNLLVPDGTNEVRIPNRNVFVFDNLLLNPTWWSVAQVFTIFGPYTGASQEGSNAPVPVLADDNLRLRGNILSVGASGMPLGIEGGDAGCPDANAACNAAQLASENAINSIVPELVAPDRGDFRPVAGGNVLQAASYDIPPFPGGDRPATPSTPASPLANDVAADAVGLSRAGQPVPGAFLPSPRTFTSTRLVPIVLTSAGANGAFFTSELTLTNRGAGNVSVTFEYVAAFGGGSGSAADALAPFRQKVVPDTIAYLRSLGVPMPESGNRGGTLRVTFSGLASPEDGAVTVRTATALPQGRAGLAYAGLPPGRMLRWNAWICGLRQDERDRSNVALVNAGEAGSGDVTLRLTVFPGDGAGEPRALDDVTLSPGAFAQVSGILGRAGFASGFVRVARVSGTAPFYAYGVLNDQATSDGSFVPPMPELSLAGRTEATLPVIVEAGSFTSELVLTNTTPEPRRLTLRFVAEAIAAPGHAAEVSLDLPARTQRVIPSFVAWLRQQGATGVGPGTFTGALFVSTPETQDLGGVFVGARTSSASFGLFYGAAAKGTGAIGEAWVYGLRQDSENRTNLALVNTGERSGEESTYRVELFDGNTGRPVPATSGNDVTVPARGFLQIGTVLRALAPGVENAYARVTRISGGNPFVAYAVVNDGAEPGQRSGDGAFVAMEGGDPLE